MAQSNPIFIFICFLGGISNENQNRGRG